MLKRLISVLASAVLAFCLMATWVSAAATVTTLQSEIVAPGEVFSVHVLLNENTGLKNLQCLLTYDASSATLLSCTDSGYFDNFTQMPIEGGIFLNWTSDAWNDNYSNGILATLTFKAEDQPTNNSLLTLVVMESSNVSGANVTVNGTTNVLQFDIGSSGGDSSDDGIIVEDEESGGIIIEDDEDGENAPSGDDGIVVEEEEEEVTTAATKATKATTTTKKTSATTTTKETTVTTTEKTAESTTTSATSAVPPETTPQSSETLSQSTPAVTGVLPDNEPQQSVSFTGDAATVSAQAKKANGKTIFWAVMIVGVTVAAIAGMEIWKRGEDSPEA